jgi:hypothetical protein
VSSTAVGVPNFLQSVVTRVPERVFGDFRQLHIVVIPSKWTAMYHDMRQNPLRPSGNYMNHLL